MKSKTVLVVLGVAVVLALTVLVAAAGAYWWFTRSAALGPLAAEALILPGDAAFIGGVDVKRITSGANYKKYLSASMGEMSSGLKELEQKTGINPERDVAKLFFAGRKQGGKDAGMALFIGRFDPARIGKAILADERHKTTTRTVEGVTVYVQEGSGTAVAVPSETLALVGSPELVEATLANRAKGAKPLASNEKLGATLRGLPPTPAIWVVAGSELIDELPKPGAGAPNVPMPRSLVLTGEVDPNVLLRLSGEMADEAAAKNLAETITGFKAMAAMMAGDKPEVKDAADALTVKAEAKQVVLTMQLSPALLEKLKASAEKARASANESAAIGDIRTVISAQAAYQSTFSAYGEMRCLADPKVCDASASGPNYVDSELGALKPRHGYKYTFQGGPPLGAGFEGFAVSAVPENPGGQAGTRSFCGDASGLICVNADGAPFDMQGGRCPEGCTPL
jgi:hypothetical protein